MNDDELGRLLSGAFDARARVSIDDASVPPPPRYATESRPVPASPHRRWVRIGAPLLAAAAVIAVIVSVALFMTGSNDQPRPVAAASSPTSSRVATSSATPTPAGAPVHIKLLNGDGSQYGVGMPVIAYFSKKITNGRPLQQATTVTVDGKATQAAWYFEPSAADRQYPIEGHLRLRDYWPAHAKIHVDIASEGISAGTGLSYNDSVTLDFATGDRTISTVDDTTHKMTVSMDGEVVRTVPVSLGAVSTPTARGVKVIMDKGRSICMRGPGYNECGIKYTQRLTYGGEYLHSAPWNITHIDKGVDSSNGCTNLRPADAKWLYDHLQIGDVVTYPNANGPTMQLGAGYGDWNVSWSTWLTGGLVPTH